MPANQARDGHDTDIDTDYTDMPRHAFRAIRVESVSCWLSAGAAVFFLLKSPAGFKPSEDSPTMGPPGFEPGANRL